MFWRKRSNQNQSGSSMISSQSTYSYQENSMKEGGNPTVPRKTRNSLSGSMSSQSDCQEYVVQPGDTLQSVAVKFGTTPSDMGLLNHWFGSTHQRQLLPGSTIKVPSQNTTDSLTIPHSVNPHNMASDPHFSPTRPAPGLASRLPQKTDPRLLTSPFSFEVIEIPEHDRTSLHDFLPAEDEEKGFVRVSADRIQLKEIVHEDSSCATDDSSTPHTSKSPAKPEELELEYVSGTIIVTPDFFVFEPQPTISPLPSQHATMTSENPSSMEMSQSSHNSPTNEQPPVIVPHPAAICQSLASIESMYTRSRLSEVWAPLCHVSNTDASETVSTTIAEQISKLVQMQEETIQRTSEIQQDENNTETKDKSSSHELCASFDVEAVLTKLFLCLQPSHEEGENLKLFSLMVFAINSHEIDEVFASMLHWGVGHSNQGHAKTKVLMSVNEDNSWDVMEPWRTAPESLASHHIEGDFESLDNPEDMKKAVLTNQNNRPPNDLVANELKRLDEEKYRPQLKGGTSEILSGEMLDDISGCLPSHLYGNNLSVIYKTSHDGFSLRSIYRKMKNVTSSVLLIIRDTNQVVFGAILSEKMRPSQYFYGKGETFVFHWNPTFQTYKWTGANTFFMKGDNHYFSVGAKSGHNAIWFEDNLKNGRSENTDTFNNPILCESSSSAFTIDCLEVWQFVA